MLKVEIMGYLNELSVVLFGNKKLQWDTPASGSMRMITISSVQKMPSTCEDESNASKHACHLPAKLMHPHFLTTRLGLPATESRFMSLCTQQCWLNKNKN